VLAFTLLYKFMPVQRVAFRVAFAGGLCAALLWHLISPLFTQMLAWSERSNAIYGSLAHVMTFSFWAFLGARILLAGAHFGATYEHVFYLRRPPAEDESFIERGERHKDKLAARREMEREVWSARPGPGSRR
jgi:membrane protein